MDLNNDGVLDVVFNNEGQESCVLLGNPEFAAKRTPVTLQVKGKTGVIGSRVAVLDKAGKLHGTSFVSGGDGRGGQASPAARFALQPGKYRVEVRSAAANAAPRKSSWPAHICGAWWTNKRPKLSKTELTTESQRTQRRKKERVRNARSKVIGGGSGIFFCVSSRCSL